ncbi:hypothetical protein [Dyella lipolytica]|uniref:Uncharacterized protein n=1 Tax=Dyella lipolytica TaxID=1867835 RepID=A0ABW8ITD2_9GAMM|nr:hypothetical protein [Dyella lipolytica]
MEIRGDYDVRFGSEADTKKLPDKLISPPDKQLNHFHVVLVIRPHADLLGAQPMKVFGHILPIGGAFKSLEYLRDIAFVLIPRLRNVGDSNWIPYVVKNFVDPV